MAQRERDQNERTAALRQRAESKLPSKLTAETTAGETRELEQVIHELQVHQIELEMQNRELREAQQALEEARDRYADFYHFATDTFKGRHASPELLPGR